MYRGETMTASELKTAADLIAYVESLYPGSTKPGKKRGNTVFTKDVNFKHIPTDKLVVVTAASVNPDSFNMALVPEFAATGNDNWWRPITEFALP